MTYRKLTPWDRKKQKIKNFFLYPTNDALIGAMLVTFGLLVLCSMLTGD